MNNAPHSQKAQPTAVGEYIDLYREHVGTDPLLSMQECAVIERLAAWAVAEAAAKSAGPAISDSQTEARALWKAYSERQGSSEEAFVAVVAPALCGPNRSSALEEAAQMAEDGFFPQLTPADRQKAIVRAIRALKNAAPQGSEEIETTASRVAPARAASEQPEAGAGRWTPEEAKRLLNFQHAHCTDDHQEAYHEIYWLVADRAADPFHPWAEVEEAAKRSSATDCLQGGKS